MVESQQVQHGGVEVPHRCRIDFSASSKLVRGTVADASFDSGSHHPAGEPVRVVIAPGGAFLMCRHASEFGRPQHQRVIE